MRGKNCYLVLGVLRADEFEPQRVLLACGRAGGGSSEEEVERDFLVCFEHLRAVEVVLAGVLTGVGCSMYSEIFFNEILCTFIFLYYLCAFHMAIYGLYFIICKTMKINIIKKNLEKYLTYKNLSNQEFERSIGVSNGYIAKLKGNMGEDILNRMLQKYPDLNCKWLQYGEGEMFNSQILLPAVTTTMQNGDNLNDVNKTIILEELRKYKRFKTQTEFADFLGITPQSISKWYKRNTYNINVLTNRFPEVNTEWLLTGNGEMLKKQTTIFTSISQTIKDRVYLFCEHKSMSIKQFEESCGMSNGYISSMRKGFGKEKLNQVLNQFPDLNRDWLLFGEGEMLKTQTIEHTIPDANINNTQNGNVYFAVSELVKQLKVKDEQISKYQEQISKTQEQIDRLITLLEKK